MNSNELYLDNNVDSVIENIDSKRIGLLDYDQVTDTEISSLYKKCAPTDFAILLGASVDGNEHVEGSYGLKDRTGWYFLEDHVRKSYALAIWSYGSPCEQHIRNVTGGIRPCIPYSVPNDYEISRSGYVGRKSFPEIEYGEYPQYVVSDAMQSELEQAYLYGIMKKTGKTYTTDSRKSDDEASPFKALEHTEYEYEGKRYVRVYCRNVGFGNLSNGRTYKYGDNVWVEVSPLKWYVDKLTGTIFSKNLIASGVRFNGDDYTGGFENTEMYKFLSEYFVKDIMPRKDLQKTSKKDDEETKSDSKKLEEIQQELTALKDQLSELKKSLQNKSVLPDESTFGTNDGSNNKKM